MFAGIYILGNLNTVNHCYLAVILSKSNKSLLVDVENFSLFIRQGEDIKDRIVPINYRLAEALQKHMEVRKNAFKNLPGVLYIIYLRYGIY